MHVASPAFTLPFLILCALLVVAYLGTLAFIALWTGSPYRKRTVTCPETNAACGLEVDGKHAVLSILEGHRELRVKSCDRWPEKQDCGQECTLQIEPSPSVLAKVFSQWYEGKCCARCFNPLGREDWDHGHVAVLAAGQLVELREVPLEKLPQALVGCQPLCIACHEEVLANLPTPEMFFKYDPRSYEMVDDPKFHN